ncbi:MAG: DUF4114 domain-containing protein, partial [Leptolyngbyaceae bacterium]|nr:DUF4114 domain-containing protein [Leptolyngbyaceae bacterium]
VQAQFTVYREARFNNTVGFYRVNNPEGAITDPLTGAVLTPGQGGYTEAALRNRVAGIDLSVPNQGVTTATGQFEAGSIFAPFIIVDGSLAAFLDDDTSNNPDVYFPYLNANPGAVDHVRLLGNNLFGFEDLANGGDRDYNDLIVRIQLTPTV